MDRLCITPQGVDAMTASCRHVAGLTDPVGEVEHMTRRPSGIMVPIRFGVLFLSEKHGDIRAPHDPRPQFAFGNPAPFGAGGPVKQKAQHDPDQHDDPGGQTDECRGHGQKQQGDVDQRGQYADGADQDLPGLVRVQRSRSGAIPKESREIGRASCRERV